MTCIPFGAYSEANAFPMPIRAYFAVTYPARNFGGTPMKQDESPNATLPCFALAMPLMTACNTSRRERHWTLICFWVSAQSISVKHKFSIGTAGTWRICVGTILLSLSFSPNAVVLVSSLKSACHSSILALIVFCNASNLSRL